MLQKDRNKLFNNWARSYDRVTPNVLFDFPFAGYENVLDKIVDLADAKKGMSILDIGSGSGNLTGRFVALGCDVIGMDFSERLALKAKIKVPAAQFIHGDILESWPPVVKKKFDRIVSGYVLHEFDLEEKIGLITQWHNNYLTDEGIIVIGDIGFPNRKAREMAKKEWVHHWDDREYYWAVDEVAEMLEDSDLSFAYFQISPCAGVYKFWVN